jgi:hypothetical protein
MLGLWLNDMESLEAITQDDEARRIFLRMAAMSRDGQMHSFLTELARDEDLDDETKGTLRELAEDDTFLLAVEDYVERTEVLHSPALAECCLRKKIRNKSSWRKAADLFRGGPSDLFREWAIVDSNHGPPPYQSGALTN